MEDNFDIQQLVEAKNFTELNAAEKSMALSEITADEFTPRRNLLLSTRLFLKAGVNGVEPNDAFKSSVAI